MQPKRRARRTSDEIRTRLLDAARELFAEKGYEATTTRDICARSGVAQTQLFHNFGSKEGIFEAAFLAPLTEVVDRYIAAWDRTRPDSTLEQRVSTLLNGLFDMASENRSILLSAVCRGALSNGRETPRSDLLDHIARTLHEMEVIEDAPAGVDIPSAIVVTAGMVFGVVLLQDMLFPSGTPPFSRERLTTEMTQMIIHGAVHRAGPTDTT